MSFAKVFGQVLKVMPGEAMSTVFCRNLIFSFLHIFTQFYFICFFSFLAYCVSKIGSSAVLERRSILADRLQSIFSNRAFTIPLLSFNDIFCEGGETIIFMCCHFSLLIYKICYLLKKMDRKQAVENRLERFIHFFAVIMMAMTVCQSISILHK